MTLQFNLSEELQINPSIGPRYAFEYRVRMFERIFDALALVYHFRMTGDDVSPSNLGQLNLKPVRRRDLELHLLPVSLSFLDEIVNVPSKRPRELAPDLPERVERVILKAMQMQKRMRALSRGR